MERERSEREARDRAKNAEHERIEMSRRAAAEEQRGRAEAEAAKLLGQQGKLRAAGITLHGLAASGRLGNVPHARPAWNKYARPRVERSSCWYAIRFPTPHHGTLQ